jgi:putative Holliday junction resolvase
VIGQAPRILALDYGRSRIGVAVSDELGLTAQPVATIAFKPKDAAFSEIGRLVGSLGIRLVIIGLPLTLKGERGQSAMEVERFAEQLGRVMDVPIKFWDERMTTALARRLLHEANVKIRKDKGKVDRSAATLLLQSYLDCHNRGPQPIEVRP